jgi:predicted phage terminase large subunit-like protein
MTLIPSEYEFILRRDFLSFAERAFYELNPQTTLLMSPYIELMAAKLEACRLGRCRRLIINVPPRHLKSQLASVALPAWYLGHYPFRHVICACYGQDLSDKFARDTRTVMQSPWYQRLFPARIAEWRTAVHDFSTTDGGTRLATSVNGPLTGRGADLIIIDDPLKPDDALSEPRRTAANQWYDNTLVSRLNDKVTGIIIIVMQRLHQDDLVGHVREQEGWEVVSFPAIAIGDETHIIDTPLGRRTYVRRAGEALHPERESLETLARIRQRSGEFTFVGQYQQNPIPIGGNLVKSAWLQFYEPGEQPARFSRIVQSWDTANKSSEINDYSVCTTWGVHDKYFYLLEVYRARLNYPELRRKVVELAGRYDSPSIVIEDKASGTQLIQDLQGEVYGVQAYEPPPGNDKGMRLHAQSAVFEQGFVLLPSSAPWLTEYVTEITGFPGTKYDDQVDSTTQALDYMRGPSRELEIWAKLGS